MRIADNEWQWFICPISLIQHRGQDIQVSMRSNDGAGEVTGQIKGWLSDIMYGNTEDEWASIVPERDYHEQ